MLQTSHHSIELFKSFSTLALHKPVQNRLWTSPTWDHNSSLSALPAETGKREGVETAMMRRRQRRRGQVYLGCDSVRMLAREPSLETLRFFTRWSELWRRWMWTTPWISRVTLGFVPLNVNLFHLFLFSTPTLLIFIYVFFFFSHSFCLFSSLSLSQHVCKHRIQ